MLAPLCLLPLTRLLLKGPQQLDPSTRAEQSHEWVKESYLKVAQKPEGGKIGRAPRIDSNSCGLLLPRDKPGTATCCGKAFKGRMILQFHMAGKKKKKEEK